jgi:hypothetical protein
MRESAAGVERFSTNAGVADAELVALRIGHDDPVRSEFGVALRLESLRSQRHQPGGFRVDVRCLDVEGMRFLVLLRSGTACRSSFGLAPSGSTSIT